MVASFIPSGGGHREFYYYASEPDEEYNSEDGLCVSNFIIKQLKIIGAVNVVALASDNAATMTKAWKIVNAIPEYSHILTYSCGCHMLNNFCKLLVNGKRLKNRETGAYFYKCDYFRNVFSTFKAVTKKLKCNDYQEYRWQLSHPTSYPPSYTEIRWNSSFNIVDYCHDQDSYQIICRYLDSLNGNELNNKDYIYFKSPEFKLLLDDLHQILKFTFLRVRQLEVDTAYLSTQYWAMSELDYLLSSEFKIKYPELIDEFEKLWCGSYNDIAAVAFVLDPLVISIRSNKKHALHKALCKAIGTHENDVDKEIIGMFGCPATELKLYKSTLAKWNNVKDNKIDAKYFQIKI